MIEKLTWKPLPNGEGLYLGKWEIARYYRDVFASIHVNNKLWKTTFKLPGIKSSAGTYADIESAKNRLIFLANKWIEGAGN